MLFIAVLWFYQFSWWASIQVSQLQRDIISWIMVLTKICNHRSEFDCRHLISWINATTTSTKDWPTWLSIALPGRPHPFIVRLLRGPMWPPFLSMVGTIQWRLWGSCVRFLSPGIPRWDRNLHSFSEFVNCDIFSLRDRYHLLVKVHFLATKL